MSVDPTTEREESESSRLIIRSPEQLSAELRNLRRDYREMESLRHLADTMPQIVWIARPDGFLEFFNRQWWEYTGLTVEQSRWDGWLAIVHPEDQERSKARWGHSLQTGELYEIEYRFRRASDGTYRWFLGRARAQRDPGGQIVKWFGTATDIHDQKQALAALQETRDQMEALARQKDEFLAVISHELRTPLNAILGWTQLIQGEVLEPGEQVEAVAAIERNAKAQARLIEDVLDISRIINHKLNVDRRPTPLAPVLRAAVDAVRPVAEAKGVRLEWSCAAPDARVLADQTRLGQIMANLLSNAVKFTPLNGLVECTMDCDNGMARLRVRDSGMGIRADFLPQVFERFRQGDSSSTRHHGGLGLGLAIVKHLVELHEGTITAESAGPGQGATFTVRLPVVAPEDKPRERPAEPAPDTLRRTALAGLRVLIVDDEESARDLIGTVLQKYGAEVIVAASAQEAFGELQARRPDILVSDIAMPETDGYALIDMVRSLPANAGGDTPAIALTAFASNQDRARALALGFNQHLAKPVEPAALVHAVAALRRS